VDYWGPKLVAAQLAHGIDDYHLAYFLDADPAAYTGTLLPIPRCVRGIQHSTSTRVTFDNVMKGSHTLHVLLVGSNDVSVNPPVAASVMFIVN
jgi:hypothetical protein